MELELRATHLETSAAVEVSPNFTRISETTSRSWRLECKTIEQMHHKISV
jgi:hypothetical protein